VLKAASIVLILATVTPAMAQKTVGYGEISCISWSKERKADTPMSLAYSGWVLGFVSGVNAIGILQSNASSDFLRATPASEMIRLTDAHCAAHPNDNLDSAGFALIGKLRESGR
jgi:hypothetical protein